MGILDLQVGQVFKTYKELCEAVGEGQKGGTAKLAQIKRFESVWEFKRAGKTWAVKTRKGEGSEGVPMQLFDFSTKTTIGDRRFLIVSELYLRAKEKGGDIHTAYGIDLDYSDLTMILGLVNTQYGLRGYVERVDNEVAEYREFENYIRDVVSHNNRILKEAAESVYAGRNSMCDGTRRYKAWDDREREWKVVSLDVSDGITALRQVAFTKHDVDSMATAVLKGKYAVVERTWTELVKQRFGIEVFRHCYVFSVSVIQCERYLKRHIAKGDGIGKVVASSNEKSVTAFLSKGDGEVRRVEERKRINEEMERQGIEWGVKLRDKECEFEEYMEKVNEGRRLFVKRLPSMYLEHRRAWSEAYLKIMEGECVWRDWAVEM